MNPLVKAVGTVLVLAAGTLGTSLGTTLDTGFLPGLPTGRASEGGGNATGNQTDDGSGNQTAGGGTGNSTGNQTAGGNSTAGNSTAGGGSGGNATGDQTTGDGNETAEDDDAEAEPEDSAICQFSVDEWGSDLTPNDHEWEWLVNRDVTHLSVYFEGYGSLGLGSGPEARLVDGHGRTIARTSGHDGSISVTLERGTDYLANGMWRLVYEADDLWSDHYVSIQVGCEG